LYHLQRRSFSRECCTNSTHPAAGSPADPSFGHWASVTPVLRFTFRRYFAACAQRFRFEFSSNRRESGSRRQPPAAIGIGARHGQRHDRGSVLFHTSRILVGGRRAREVRCRADLARCDQKRADSTPALPTGRRSAHVCHHTPFVQPRTELCRSRCCEP
jgi:hypothetical protein